MSDFDTPPMSAEDQIEQSRAHQRTKIEEHAKLLEDMCGPTADLRPLMEQWERDFYAKMHRRVLDVGTPLQEHQKRKLEDIKERYT